MWTHFSFVSKCVWFEKGSRITCFIFGRHWGPWDFFLRSFWSSLECEISDDFLIDFG